MANLFKGFKQVLGTTYASTSDENKKGYIWFVRTVVDDKTEPTGNEKNPDNNLTNDVYDIYFGTKHYGHYQKGELTQLRADLETIKTELGLGENFELNLVREKDDFYESSTGTDMTAKDAFMKIADEIIADKKNLAEYETSNNAVVAKHAVDVVYTRKGDLMPGQEQGGTTADKHYLSLKLENGHYTNPIDVDDFIKDGMIESVTTSGTYPNKKIIIHWNTDGKKSDTEIKVSELYKPYEAGYGINIKASEPNKGDIISVSEIHTDITKTKEEITIEGGPLAELAKEVYKDGKLPKDTNMQDFLFNMLCVEKWPEKYTYQEASLTSSVGEPTITMSSDTVEVGASVSYIVKNGASSATAKNFKVSGLTYGYSETDTLTKPELVGYHSATSKESTHTDITASAPATTLTLSGFSKETKNGTNVAASATITGTRVATEGANTIGASNTSSKYTATFNELPVVYGVSNLKNTKNSKENDKTYPTEIRKQKEITSEQVTATASEKSFTGAYYAFVGYSDTVPTKSEELVAMKTNGLSRLGKGLVKGGAEGTCDKLFMTIAYPSGKGWSFDIQNSIGTDMSNKFREYKVSDIEYSLPSGDKITYTVYSMPYANGIYKNLRIK